MGLFKKKTDYSYYSSYSSSRRRLKVGRTVIAVIAAVVVILGIIIYFNFNRIQFLMKGYSGSDEKRRICKERGIEYVDNN